MAAIGIGTDLLSADPVSCTTQVKRTEWQVCAADPDSGMAPENL